MSRWSRRSDEEKQRIYEQQHKTSEERTGVHDKDAVEIYKQGFIPIMCPKCMRWSTSKKYQVIDEVLLPGLPSCTIIRGLCCFCGSIMKRVLLAYSDDTVFLVPIMLQLKQNGSLVDLRKQRG